MDEFVKDVAASNMGMLLNNVTLVVTIHCRCKGEWI